MIVMMFVVMRMGVSALCDLAAVFIMWYMHIASSILPDFTGPGFSVLLSEYRIICPDMQEGISTGRFFTAS